MKTNEQFRSGVTREVYTLWNVVLDQRMGRALSEGVSRYPIYRVLRFAARIELDVLLDAIALDPAWRAERVSMRESMLLDGTGCSWSAYGSRKADYCSCIFHIWAADVARPRRRSERLLDEGRLDPHHRADVHDRLALPHLAAASCESAEIEEMANDVLRDGAYPEIEGGVRAFIARYLDAPETVLVLQGPPGTGKTRLIRAILGEISRRKGERGRRRSTPAT